MSLSKNESDTVWWHLQQDTWNTLPTLIIEHAQISARIRNDDDTQQIEPEEAAFYIEYNLSKLENYLISMASVRTLNSSGV